MQNIQNTNSINYYDKFIDQIVSTIVASLLSRPEWYGQTRLAVRADWLTVEESGIKESI